VSQTSSNRYTGRFKDAISVIANIWTAFAVVGLITYLVLLYPSEFRNSLYTRRKSGVTPIDYVVIAVVECFFFNGLGGPFFFQLLSPLAGLRAT
jgi:hypothetical protein